MTAIPRLLEGYVAEARNRKFDWGSSNCCHFANGWLKLVRGRDCLLNVTLPASRRGVIRLVECSGGTLSGLLEKILGVAPVSATFAKTGDVVFTPPGAAGGLGFVGVCSGRTSIFVSDGGGLVSAPTSKSTLAWRLEDL